jgi:hypothetical protein
MLQRKIQEHLEMHGLHINPKKSRIMNASPKEWFFDEFQISNTDQFTDQYTYLGTEFRKKTGTMIDNIVNDYIDKTKKFTKYW